MKKLTPQAINEVLDVAFQKLPFHVYMVMCDVGEIALKVERSQKEAKNKHLGSKARKKMRCK
jgi:hypothetical protein